MAIRFCKGVESELLDKQSIKASKELFKEAHELFATKGIEYIPIRDHFGNYLYTCYDDGSMDHIQSHLWNMFSSKTGSEFFKSFTEVTIVSCNEIGVQLATIFYSMGIGTYVCGGGGEIWDVVYPEMEVVDHVIGYGIYCEGNEGLSLAELARWRNVAPLNEYEFIEQWYTKHQMSLYNREWLSREKSNQILAEKILHGKKYMIARLGNTESQIVGEYLHGSYTRTRWNWLYSTSGFFSDTKYSSEDICRYAELTIEAIKKCDIHCSLRGFDSAIKLINEFADDTSVNVDWCDYFLGFYENKNFWMNALAGKKVLIISSISKTIKHQYGNREKIFEGHYVLPDIDLLFYNAIQSQLGNNCGYKNWFQAYEQMVDDISKIDFDFAIIAAGAYGYPLAAAIKEMGKQAMVIASGIYQLFGIKIKRYCVNREISSMYNKHWIFPLADNVPEGYQKIEQGCYWD